MLVSVLIRNIVLIDKLHTTFGKGLCVLTGETGAGKSILLDALGLALGMRANINLIRNADKKPKELRNASVTASFQIPSTHGVYSLLADYDINNLKEGEPLILRRNLDQDGRGGAYINDQPVSVSLLRTIGEQLVEIEGQFASQGLMDQKTHRTALDNFAGIRPLCNEVAHLYDAWKKIDNLLEKESAEYEKNRADEDYVLHSLEELQQLNPQTGEEVELSKTRSLLINSERLIRTLVAIENSLSADDGVEDRLGAAQRSILKENAESTEALSPILNALSAATDSVAEAQHLLNRLMQDAAPDPTRLENCEERLFSLRALARKHNITVEELPSLQKTLEQRIKTFTNADEHIGKLQIDRDKAYEKYKIKSEKLSKKRHSAAKKLDKGVCEELPPLRLEKATFYTRVETLDKRDWGRHGIDRVYFEISTNPGTEPGPITQIASGGELARFLLALKMVLKQNNAVPTLIFDEVDAGIGGAVAAAVGERLAKLSEDIQVLTITHSPQVAAYGLQHLKISKSEKNGSIFTQVTELDENEKNEEIARMLAGIKITEEARAAAASLLFRGTP